MQELGSSILTCTKKIQSSGKARGRGGQLVSISLENRLADRGPLFGEIRYPHQARTDVTVEIMLHFFFSSDLDGPSLNGACFVLGLKWCFPSGFELLS